MDAHSKQQKRIDIESISNRIMLMLIQYQSLSRYGSLTDGLLWSSRMITDRLKVSEKDASTALLYLMRLGYIEQRGEEWVKTIDGEMLFREEMRDTRIRTSPLAFREEALTGMDAYGERTKLTKAALPRTTEDSSSGRNREEDEALSVSLRASAIRVIARDLGIGPDEVSEGLRTGRVRRCKGIDGVEHWGIFHKRIANGKYWRSLCKDCLNRKRRKK